MDGIGAAASIISIATAGVQISIKLITLASQISTASERISSIGNDVSLTSGVLQQLGDLMTQKAADNDTGISIFSQGGSETTKSSASMCQRIFEEIDKAMKKASEQLRSKGRFSGSKIKPSRMEKAKWPFLQPSIESLRIDLREAKGALMLILQVTTLAFSKRMAELNNSPHLKVVYAILAIQRERQSASDINNREHRSNSGQEDRRALLSTTSRKTNSANSEDKLILKSIPATSRNLPNVFEPSVSMAMPFEQPRVQNLVTSNQHDESSNHLDRTDQCQDIGTERTPNRSSNKESESIRFVGGNRRGQQDSTSNNNTDLPSLDHVDNGLNSLPVTANRDGEVEGKTLQLFLLKPIIKDFIDMTQLSWDLCDVRISQDDIRKQLVIYEQNDNPAMWDVMESLYPHEHKVINSKTSAAGPRASLASLKRTKADIQHRDIMFQCVPGLHFIVQRQDSSGENPEFGSQERVIDSQIRITSSNGPRGFRFPRFADNLIETIDEEAYQSPNEEAAKEAAREAENKVLPSLTRVSDLATISDLSDPGMMFSDMAMVADMEHSGAKETVSYPKLPNRYTPSTSERVKDLDVAQADNNNISNPLGASSSRLRKSPEDLSILKDKVVAATGNFVDEHGTVYDRAIKRSSDLTSAERLSLTGQHLDEEHLIRSDPGELGFSARPMSLHLPQLSPRPSLDIEHPAVAQAGPVSDSDNQVVGQVLDDTNFVKLVGARVGEIEDFMLKHDQETGQQVHMFSSGPYCEEDLDFAQQQLEKPGKMNKESADTKHPRRPGAGPPQTLSESHMDDEFDPDDEDCLIDDYTDDHEDRDARTKMEQTMFDLLGKYTTLFETQGNGKRRFDPLFGIGVL